jgi:hypothetical protein
LGSHDFRKLLTAIGSGLRLAETNSDECGRVRAYVAEATLEGGLLVRRVGGNSGDTKDATAFR